MRSVLDWFSGLRDGGGRRAKRKTIEFYLARLPALLAKDYGGLGPYTPAQVERALTRHGIAGEEYSVYALAIFCDRDDVAEMRPEVDYDVLRGEIAGMFFDSDVGFNVSASRLLSRTPDKRWDTLPHGGGDAIGGGGDGGHGGGHD